MKPKKQKSGFEQGRSKTRPSLSGSKKEKTNKLTKAEKRLKKLKEAKEELAEVLRETGVTKKKKRNRDHGEGFPGSDGIEAEVSIFEEEMEAIREMVSAKSDDFNAEAANKMLLRSMLMTVLDIIPIAERAFRATSKENAAYAVNALINQAREISTDLKMAGDVENQSRFIKESIIDPMYKAIAQNMLQELLSLKSVIDTELSNKPKTAKTIKRSVDSTLRTIGMFMTQSSEKISSDIESYLAGDMSAIGSSGKKRKRGQ